MASGAIEAGRAFVRVYTDDSDFRRGLDRSRSYLTQWGAAISRAGVAMFSSGLALGGLVEGAVLAFGTMGAELARAAERTGIAVEQLSQLKYAAAQAGLEFDDLQRAIARMNRNLVQVEQGGGTAKAAKAFADLKISVADLEKLSPLERFKLIAERIAAIEDPSRRSGLAMELFGSSSGTAAAKLLTLLDQGKTGIEKLMTQASSLGLTISTADAKAALELQQRLSDLWSVIKVGVAVIGGLFAPMVRGLVTMATGVIIAVRRWADAHKSLAQNIAGTVGLIVGGLLAAGLAEMVFGRGLMVVGKIFGFLMTGSGLLWRLLKFGFSSLLTVLLWIPPIIGAIGTAIGFLFSPVGLLIAGIVLLGYEILKVGGTFTAMQRIGGAVVNYLIGEFKAFWADTMTAFDGIRAALASGDWALAASIMWEYIELEWLKGSGFLKKIWWEVKAWFITTNADMLAAVAEATVFSAYYMEGIWVEFISSMKSAWNGFASFFADIWDKITGIAAKAIIDIEQVSGTLTPLQAYEAKGGVDRETERKSISRHDEDESSEESDQKKLNAITAERDGILAALAGANKEVDDAANGEAKKKIDNLNQQIDELKAQLYSDTRKAERESAGKHEPTWREPEWDQEKSEQEQHQASTRSSSAWGTFNPSVLWGFGGGRTQERIASATEKSEKQLVEIHRLIERKKPAEFH